MKEVKKEEEIKLIKGEEVEDEDDKKDVKKEENVKTEDEDVREVTEGEDEDVLWR